MIKKGYKGIYPDLTTTDLFYLDAIGASPNTKTYTILCEWYIRTYLDGETPKKRAAIGQMQIDMAHTIFPESAIRGAELCAYLQQIFVDYDKPYSEILIRRYNLDIDNCYGLTPIGDVQREFAELHSCCEATIGAWMKKAFSMVQADPYFLEYPNLDQTQCSEVNLWQFLLVITNQISVDELLAWPTDEDIMYYESLLTKLGTNFDNLEQRTAHLLSLIDQDLANAIILKFSLNRPLFLNLSDQYILNLCDLGDSNLMGKIQRFASLEYVNYLLGANLSREDFLKLSVITPDSSVEQLGFCTKSLDYAKKQGITNFHDLDAWVTDHWNDEISSKEIAELVTIWHETSLKTGLRALIAS